MHFIELFSEDSKDGIDLSISGALSAMKAFELPETAADEVTAALKKVLQAADYVKIRVINDEHQVTVGIESSITVSKIKSSLEGCLPAGDRIAFNADNGTRTEIIIQKKEQS